MFRVTIQQRDGNALLPAFHLAAGIDVEHLHVLQQCSPVFTDRSQQITCRNGGIHDNRDVPFHSREALQFTVLQVDPGTVI
ncbi:hypothetical protein D3C81_2153340 [compost metagenome]